MEIVIDVPPSYLDGVLPPEALADVIDSALDGDVRNFNFACSRVLCCAFAVTGAFETELFV